MEDSRLEMKDGDAGEPGQPGNVMAAAGTSKSAPIAEGCHDSGIANAPAVVSPVEDVDGPGSLDAYLDFHLQGLYQHFGQPHDTDYFRDMQNFGGRSRASDSFMFSMATRYCAFCNTARIELPPQHLLNELLLSCHRRNAR
jgi:hypothetical protein